VVGAVAPGRVGGGVDPDGVLAGTGTVEPPRFGTVTGGGGPSAGTVTGGSVSGGNVSGGNVTGSAGGVSVTWADAGAARAPIHAAAAAHQRMTKALRIITVRFQPRAVSVLRDFPSTRRPRSDRHRTY